MAATSTQMFATNMQNLNRATFATPAVTVQKTRLYRTKSIQMRSIHGTKLVQIKCICSNREKQKWIVSKPRYRTQCNAGAAELGGSGIGSIEGIPGQDVDRENRFKKKKKKKVFVAGVDQDELVDPPSLADSDSLFVEFNGIHLHHKLAECSTEISVAGTSNLDNGVNGIQSDIGSSIGIPAILLHGFGASVFSWNRVLKPLARLIGSKVLAFDRPAFGLTSRIELPDSGNPLSMNPYSIGFSAAATVSFIDLLQSQKAILIG